jgi:hypothetical protein
MMTIVQLHSERAYMTDLEVQNRQLAAQRKIVMAEYHKEILDIMQTDENVSQN